MNIHRVLIVDDSPDQVESLGALLSMYRIAWEGAGSLGAAFARLRLPGADIDCVLLDLTLPDASGVQAVERAQASFPRVPVIVVTGYGDLAERCIAAGAQDVFTKPADPETLVERVRFAIARHQVRSRFEPFTRELDEAKRLVADELTRGA